MTSRRWRLYAMGFAAFAVFVLMLEVFPRTVEAVSLGRQWVELRDGSGDDVAMDAERVQLGRERVELRQELGERVAQHDGQSHLSVVISALQQAAEEAGVVVVRIEPGEVAEQGRRSLQPIRTVVRGSGHAVGRFVDELERSGALLTVKTLAVTGPEFEPGTAEATVEMEAIRLGMERGG